MLDPSWLDFVRLAEASLKTDPHNSCVKGRFLSEKIEVEIARREKIYVDSRGDHFERLKMLQREGFLDASIASFHNVRMSGNGASHGRGGNREDAEWAWQSATTDLTLVRPELNSASY